MRQSETNDERGYWNVAGQFFSTKNARPMRSRIHLRSASNRNQAFSVTMATTMNASAAVVPTKCSSRLTGLV